jgi:hypothetical protein
MPLVKCPNCGRVMSVNHDVVGNLVGCLMPRCETQFVAVEVRRHSNFLSQMVFFAVIVSAIALSLVWFNRQYQFF